MAVELAGQIELGTGADGRSLNAFAVFDGQQWASLCPELDIASVGGTADEALDSVVEAVGEAIAFAKEHGLEAGRPVPPDVMRTFLISSQAPFAGRNFFV